MGDAPDGQCGQPPDLAACFECLGLAWPGLVGDLAHGDESVWTSMRKHKRLVYITVDVALVTLLLCLLGLALRRK